MAAFIGDIINSFVSNNHYLAPAQHTHTLICPILLHKLSVAGDQNRIVEIFNLSLLIVAKSVA